MPADPTFQFLVKHKYLQSSEIPDGRFCKLSGPRPSCYRSSASQVFAFLRIDIMMG